jgi:hypothetical protein
MSDADSQFFDNFKGSALANVVSAALFLILYIVREKCKHSKCEFNTKCCRCKCKDDDDSGDEESCNTRKEKGEGRFERQQTFQFPRKAKKEMQKLHVRIDQGLHEKYPPTIPSDGRGLCSIDGQLAEKERNV